MHSVSRDTLRSLLNGHEPPCISLYQPTHRTPPDRRQDTIRFKNLLRTVEESLRQKYSGSKVRPILERLQTLAGDVDFWQHTLDGLAVLASSDTFLVLQLQQPVQELTIVADSFHVKPLLRYVQSVDRFQVLALNRHTAKVYEGNRYALDSLDLGDFPATITAALGEDLTEPYHKVSSHGKGVGGPAMHHGQGSRKDEIDKDTERFFRVVDREVLTRFSKPSGLPLILVSLPEHAPIFRTVSQNLMLVPKGVERHPDRMAPNELLEAVWAIVESQYVDRLTKLSEEFKNAEAHRLASADLPDVSRAAVKGRVATLLVEAERIVPGRMNPADGAIEESEPAAPGVDDLLDDVCEVVLRAGGEVVVVPKERMPAATGIAATFRY